ncbi:mCG146507, partial [Mus musculus]
QPCVEPASLLRAESIVQSL